MSRLKYYVVTMGKHQDDCPEFRLGDQVFGRGNKYTMMYSTFKQSSSLKGAGRVFMGRTGVTGQALAGKQVEPGFSPRSNHFSVQHL